MTDLDARRALLFTRCN